MLGICLRAISLAQNALFVLSIGEKIKDAVGFSGCGYLRGTAVPPDSSFRDGLAVPICPQAKPRASMILAVIASSLLFAAAHHVGPYGEPWAVYPFVFRCVAGVFLVLFVYRGFGIAAGSHAAYDILTWL